MSESWCDACRVEHDWSGERSLSFGRGDLVGAVVKACLDVLILGEFENSGFLDFWACKFGGSSPSLTLISVAGYWYDTYIATLSQKNVRFAQSKTGAGLVATI